MATVAAHAQSFDGEKSVKHQKRPWFSTGASVVEPEMINAEELR